MKHGRMAVVSLVIVGVFLHCFVALANVSDKSEVHTLLNRIAWKDMERIEEKIPGLAENAGVFLNDHREDLIMSDIQEEDLLNLTLSKPIPVFSTKIGYQYTDDYLSGLVNEQSYIFLCYAEGKPVGQIRVTKSGIAEYAGESAATHFDAISQRLGGDVAAVLPEQGQYFFLSGDGSIAMDQTSPLKTFNEFCSAVQETRIYYKQNSGAMEVDGGGGLIERLYPELSETVNSPSGANRAVLLVIVPLLSLFLAAMVVLYIKSSKKRGKA